MNFFPIMRAVYARYNSRILATIIVSLSFIAGAIIFSLGYFIFKLIGEHDITAFGIFIFSMCVISVTIALTLVVLALIYNRLLPKKTKSDSPKEPTKADEKSSKTETKSGKGLSKAAWVLLTVFVGLPVLGVFIMLSGWLYGTYHQRQEKVWIATLARMPGHKDQYDIRNFSSRICEVVDTPASFQMSCSNKYGKDIYKWDDKSSPDGKWWRENRENDVGGTFRIQKVSPTLYLGVEKTRSGKEGSFHVSLENK